MENEINGSGIISVLTIDPTKKNTTVTLPNNILISAGNFCVKHKKSFLAAGVTFSIVEILSGIIKKSA